MTAVIPCCLAASLWCILHAFDKVHKLCVPKARFAMTRLLPLTAVLFVFGAVPAPPGKFQVVDLQPKANHKLADSLGGDGNELTVAKGEKTYDGIHFKIGGSILHL